MFKHAKRLCLIAATAALAIAAAAAPAQAAINAVIHDM